MAKQTTPAQQETFDDVIALTERIADLSREWIAANGNSYFGDLGHVRGELAQLAAFLGDTSFTEKLGIAY